MRKKYKCNRGYTKSYTTQKNTKMENHSICKRHFDDTVLTADPVEVIHKKSGHRNRVQDREIVISSLEHASNNNEELEAWIANQKFRQYHSENDQDCKDNSANILPLFKTHEKCPKCIVSKEKKMPKVQEMVCFPHDRYSPPISQLCYPTILTIITSATVTLFFALEIIIYYDY